MKAYEVLLIAAAAVGVVVLNQMDSAKGKDTARAPSESETSVASAYYLCTLADQTGMASSRCKVSGWNSTVTVTVDMASSEARDVCGKIAGLMRQKGKTFSPGWTLQIKSPYSGDNSIAYCNL